MSTEAYQDFRVGDRVYCLAWLGVPFDVVAKNDDHQMISIQAPASARYGAQIDIMPDTFFMLTHQPWDQIWYWPDRAGERYDQVFDRFIRKHRESEVVNGYFFEAGLGGLTINPEPRRAMAFRIRTFDHGARQIRVHPVAAIGDDGKILIAHHQSSIPSERWLKSGPTVPLRLEMRQYRWCLSYGEMVLNWEDFQ